MKILRYLLKHNNKVIGFFTTRSAACTFWTSVVCKDISKIDEYRITEVIVPEGQDLSLLEAE